MSKITFLGTGTSQGVPVISCRCRVCMSNDQKDKRLRSAAMIEHEGNKIVIDAGPDFRHQMLSVNATGIDGILITHEHKDHIGGLDEVRGFNYTTGQPVDIYATERVQKTILKHFDYAFGENKYPGAPDMNLITIEPDRTFGVKGIEVAPISGMHYNMPVLGFRIGQIAYLTDFNFIYPESIDKIKGVDILVINALRHEPHLSHFNLTEALAVREMVNPRLTFFTHVSHQIGLYSEEEGKLPEGTFLSYDGLTAETI